MLFADTIIDSMREDDEEKLEHLKKILQNPPHPMFNELMPTLLATQDGDAILNGDLRQEDVHTSFVSLRLTFGDTYAEMLEEYVLALCGYLMHQ